MGGVHRNLQTSNTGLCALYLLCIQLLIFRQTWSTYIAHSVREGGDYRPASVHTVYSTVIP